MIYTCYQQKGDYFEPKNLNLYDQIWNQKKRNEMRTIVKRMNKPSKKVSWPVLWAPALTPIQKHLRFPNRFAHLSKRRRRLLLYAYICIITGISEFPAKPSNWNNSLSSAYHYHPHRTSDGKVGVFINISHQELCRKKEKTQTQIRIDKIFWSKGFHIMPGLGPVFLEACMCGIASSSSPQPEDCGIRESFSYQKLPQQLLRLSVLKLDGSCFGILIGNPLLCI